MAEFLQWPVEELLAHMPTERRVLPVIDGQHRLLARPETKTAVPVVSTVATATTNYDAVLVEGGAQRFLECREFAGRTDVFCMYLHSTRMTPWRQEGELVLAEKERPPKDLDHVIIYMEEHNEVRVLIRQLMKTTENAYRIKQHCPTGNRNIPRKSVSSIFRVLTWDDVFR